MYLLWVAALLLKLIGSSIDVSWHFRHLRETFGTPHLINTAGLFLALGLAIAGLRSRRGRDRPLITVWLGLGVFFAAIPLDELSHRLYGLDVTSWSLTHFLLYLGTFLMIVGAYSGYLRDAAAGSVPWRLWLPVAFCVFLLETMVFPLGHQEYGAIAYWLIQHGRFFADAELMYMARVHPEQAFGGLPPALYCVYMVGSYLFGMTVARRTIPHRWAATLVTGTYLGYRAVLWGALYLMGLPVSSVPYYVLVAALVVDGAALLRRLEFPSLTVGCASALAVYAAAWGWSHIALMPPWDMSSIWLAASAGIVGIEAASWLSRSLLQPRATQIPSLSAVP